MRYSSENEILNELVEGENGALSNLMEPLQLVTPTTQNQPMTSLSLSLSLSSKLKLKRPNPFWFSSYSQLRAFCTSPLSPSKPISASGNGVGVRAKVSDAQLKDNWLASLSCPFLQTRENFDGTADSTRTNSDSSWVIGVDPDLSGALALLKGDESGCSAQVNSLPCYLCFIFIFFAS